MGEASLLKTHSDSRGTDQAKEGSPYGFQAILLLGEEDKMSTKKDKYKAVDCPAVISHI